MVKGVRTLLLLGVLVAGLEPASGQSDPLYVLSGGYPADSLVAAPRAVGPAVTVRTLPAGHSFSAMTSGPGDDTVYVLGGVTPRPRSPCCRWGLEA